MGDFELNSSGLGESPVEYHPFSVLFLTVGCETSRRTVCGRQFDWGGCLLKSTASAQRLTQPGWKSGEECIGISQLYCEGDIPSSYESRSK